MSNFMYATHSDFLNDYNFERKTIFNHSLQKVEINELFVYIF